MVSWADELAAILAEAKGDLALFLAVVALRLCEWGGPGKEWGVLSEDAPFYANQLHIAATSFHHHETRCQLLMAIRDPTTGLYRDEFLRAFSAHWAPVDVENDPNHLNERHASNLVSIYHRLSSPVLQAMVTLPGKHDASPTHRA
jgi:hypothetical protein